MEDKDKKPVPVEYSGGELTNSIVYKIYRGEYENDPLLLRALNNIRKRRKLEGGSLDIEKTRILEGGSTITSIYYDGYAP